MEGSKSMVVIPEVTTQKPWPGTMVAPPPATTGSPGHPAAAECDVSGRRWRSAPGPYCGADARHDGATCRAGGTDDVDIHT